MQTLTYIKCDYQHWTKQDRSCQQSLMQLRKTYEFLAFNIEPLTTGRFWKSHVFTCVPTTVLQTLDHKG